MFSLFLHNSVTKLFSLRNLAARLTLPENKAEAVVCFFWRFIRRGRAAVIQCRLQPTPTQSTLLADKQPARTRKRGSVDRCLADSCHREFKCFAKCLVRTCEPWKQKGGMRANRGNKVTSDIAQWPSTSARPYLVGGPEWV